MAAKPCIFTSLQLYGCETIHFYVVAALWRRNHTFLHRYSSMSAKPCIFLCSSGGPLSAAPFCALFLGPSSAPSAALCPRGPLGLCIWITHHSAAETKHFRFEMLRFRCRVARVLFIQFCGLASASPFAASGVGRYPQCGIALMLSGPFEAVFAERDFSLSLSV